MNDFPADTLFAFVKGYRRQVYGARPEGSKPLQWIVMGGETVKRSPWKAIKKRDSLSLIFVVSQKDETAFQKETRAMDAMGSWVVENDSLYPQGRNNGVGVPVISYGPIRVTAKIDPSLRQEGIYLKKAMEAVANYVGRDMAWSEVPLATGWDVQTTDLFIGLGATPPKTYDGNYLVYKALPYAAKTIVRDTSPGAISLPQFWMPNGLPSQKSHVLYSISSIPERNGNPQCGAMMRGKSRHINCKLDQGMLCKRKKHRGFKLSMDCCRYFLY